MYDINNKAKYSSFNNHQKNFGKIKKKLNNLFLFILYLL